MKVRVALAQLISFKFDLEKNFEKAETACRRAKLLKADIILFPEMWSIGYESFSEAVFENTFDVSNIPEEVSRQAAEWSSLAIDINSDGIKRFSELAKELNLSIVMTFLQKGKTKPYNSAILIDRQGRIIQNYKKVHTCDFSLEHFCESGKEFFVSDLDVDGRIVRTGLMICFDREFPESARELMLKGAELILIPNACDMEQHRSQQLSSRAFENMTAIALTNYPKPKCNGRSQAYSPVVFSNDGESIDNTILKADENEGIEIAEFDMDLIREYRRREVWGNKFRKPGAYISQKTKK